MTISRAVMPAVIAAALLGAGGAGAVDAWRVAKPGFAWSFPRDHWAHREYRNEWWYLTGRLSCRGEPSRIYGYQFTFFRVGVLHIRPDLASPWATAGAVMGHAAVTDIAAGSHRFSELIYREIPLLGGFAAFPDPRVAWSRAPAGTDGEWTLRFNGEAFDIAMADETAGFSFDLRTRPMKPLVLQGPGGISRKGSGEGAASLYYSFTRLATEGTVTFDGRSCAVSGVSWMDKEFGTNQLGRDQVGWDWFSLRLDDGRDLMLYLLRGADEGAGFRSGTVVSEDGAPRYLDPQEWSVRATRTWTSPASGAVYPSRWIIEVPGEGLRLDVSPALADQENRGRLAGGIVYWEGAVVASAPGGGPTGEGYVELTGYAPGARPPL